MPVFALTGCGGQRPRTTVCSKRSLRLVWIFARTVCEGQGAGDTLSRPTVTCRLCIPRGPFYKQCRITKKVSFKAQTVSSCTKRGKSDGNEKVFFMRYLVLHALFDALVVPSQLCVLWIRVSLQTNWHTTFNRRHCHLTCTHKHTQGTRNWR